MAYGEDQRAALDPEGAGRARREIAAWPGYAPTPLRSLPGLAAALGVRSVLYKDEAGRFRLGSFKALGGAYAVYRWLAGELERSAGMDGVSAAALAAGEHTARTRNLTVCCATDGNHGRSVAWGGRTFGCRCVIYIHQAVSEGRRRAIEALGATVHRVPGSYDDAVRQAAADAASRGWTVVSDTSYPGYTSIPRDVMHGYTLMVDEILSRLPADQCPTHVFVQGGVGAVAAAVCARLWWEFGGERPCFVVAEPDGAACLFESAVAGRPVALAQAPETLMAGLACGEVSLLAWDVLAPGADFFACVPDAAAVDLMRALADGVSGDAPVVAGESAVAGLAVAVAACAGGGARELALGPESRVLVFGTEGATDPALYRAIVGREAHEVSAE